MPQKLYSSKGASGRDAPGNARIPWNSGINHFPRLIGRSISQYLESQEIDLLFLEGVTNLERIRV